MSSCGSKECSDSYAECDFTARPDYANLHIQNTINAGNDSVRIEVYERNINRGDVPVYTFYTRETSNNLEVSAGKYSVKAIYNRNGETLWVIRKTEVVIEEYSCDIECWSVENGDVDVRM